MSEINKLPFNIYGIMILLSLALGWIILSVILYRRKTPKMYILYTLILSFMMTFFGAMELTYIQNGFEGFFWEWGISSMGAAIGSFFAAFIMDIILGKKYQILDAQVRVLPFIYSVAKIGCHFAGCCRGRIHSGFPSVTYVFEGPDSFLAIQLIETFTFMVIFLLGMTLLKDKHWVIIVSVSMLAKVLLDFGRLSNKGSLGFTQIVCIVFAIVGILITALQGRKKTNKASVKNE